MVNKTGSILLEGTIVGLLRALCLLHVCSAGHHFVHAGRIHTHGHLAGRGAAQTHRQLQSNFLHATVLYQRTIH